MGSGQVTNDLASRYGAKLDPLETEPKRPIKLNPSDIFRVVRFHFSVKYNGPASLGHTWGSFLTKARVQQIRRMQELNRSMVPGPPGKEIEINTVITSDPLTMHLTSSTLTNTTAEDRMSPFLETQSWERGVNWFFGVTVDLLQIFSPKKE